MEKRKKTVALVTSTRADWGLLKNVAKEISSSKKLDLFLIVTGTHLLSEFGDTVNEIIADGFTPQAKAQIFKFPFDAVGTGKNIAHTISVFTDIFSENTPDLVLILGDRYEIFAVATAAANLSIPIGHISGGDVTVGAKDDFYRHCITKMANIHFPSCADSAKRLIQLGENPLYVHNVGGLGNENIKTAPLLSFGDLKKSLEIKNLPPYALVTYHPTTGEKSNIEEDIKRILKRLDKTDLYLIFTKSNADSGGKYINKALDEYCIKNSHRAKVFYSLGAVRYLSCMKYCRVVVGNSSSGVVETPAFKVPCVNIGTRQKGRYAPANVISVPCEENAIYTAVETAISQKFKVAAKNAANPYDAGFSPSKKIAELLEKYLDNPGNMPKNFYDVKFWEEI
jgi:GDP/UDP-N,N'-diacetylbacillosamine 2-epimerase (hydrolysing)